MTQSSPSFRCAFCNSLTPPHYVHGHLQCSTCGKNVDECCSGEQCIPELMKDTEEVDNVS